MKYPKQYLYVQHSRTGSEFIMKFRSDCALDIEHLVKKWVKKEFNGNFKPKGFRHSSQEGEYYASIVTDGREPNGIVYCSCCFDLDCIIDS